MTDNKVLYVGCIVVTLKEVRVCGKQLECEATRSGGAQFCVRTAVAVAETATHSIHERFCERVNSSIYSFKNSTMMEQMVIPVMLLRSPSTIATMNGSKHNDKVNTNGSADRVRNGNSDVTDLGANGEDMDVGLDLFLDISFLHGETMVWSLRRRVEVESLDAIASHNCGVAVARVSTDVLQSNGVLPTSEAVRGGSAACDASDGREDDEWSGLELHVIVRSMDMSEPIRLMVAAEREASTFLDLPQREPQTVFLLPLRHAMPYNALPLEVLYQFYCCFYEYFFNKPVKVFGHVVNMLRTRQPGGMGDNKTRGGAVTEGRWSELRSADLRPLLLGEDALAPVLATLFHCPGLRELLLDQNSLSDITCYRIRSLFYRHRHLETLSIARNNIHEGGGEQLVRLIRRNKRLIDVKVSGNHFTHSMSSRIQRVASLNEEYIRGDPYNVFSSAYSYVVSPTSFPANIIKQALAVWAMLSAAPVSTVIVDCVPNSTFGIDLMGSPNNMKSNGSLHGSALDNGVVEATDKALESSQATSIPHCALSPLLNEVMRTVALRMSSILHDPWALLVFSDIESHWERCTITLREQKEKCSKQDAQVAADGREDGPASIRHGEAALCEVEDLYAISFLHLVVVTMRAVGRSMDWEDASSVLRDIGRKQMAIGILEENYRDAIQIFVQSLAVVCGKDEADVEHSAAFLQCLALGVRTAVAA